MNKLRRLMFGDMPTYQVVEEIVGGVSFLALILGLMFLYVMQG